MKQITLILITIFLAIACSPKIGNNTGKLTGDKISDQFIKALGGAKKLKAVKTMTMIAVAQIQGVELQIESYREAPDKMVVKMKSPQGEMTRILNGEKAVVLTPDGNQPISIIDLEALKEEATIFPELYKEQFGYRLEYIGKKEVDGSEMYKVKFSKTDGAVRYQFYDPETHLLTKMIDELGAESFYEDYREIEGVKIPHTNKLVTPQGTLNFKVVEIKINPAFAAEMFEIE